LPETICGIKKITDAVTLPYIEAVVAFFYRTEYIFIGYTLDLFDNCVFEQVYYERASGTPKNTK
jgi:hypothetical protein